MQMADTTGKNNGMLQTMAEPSDGFVLAASLDTGALLPLLCIVISFFNTIATDLALPLAAPLAMHAKKTQKRAASPLTSLLWVFGMRRVHCMPAYSASCVMDL